jgi:hypothetical protein
MMLLMQGRMAALDQQQCHPLMQQQRLQWRLGSRQLRQ